MVMGLRPLGVQVNCPAETRRRFIQLAQSVARRAQKIVRVDVGRIRLNDPLIKGFGILHSAGGMVRLGLGKCFIDGRHEISTLKQSANLRGWPPMPCGGRQQNRHDLA